MPNMDGTGPQGNGPGGKGLGPCGRGNRGKFDDTGRKGGRRRFSEELASSSPEEKIAALNEEIALLRTQLEATEARLAKVETE